MQNEKQVRAARKAEKIAEVYREELKDELYNDRQTEIVNRIVLLLDELKSALL